MISTAQRRWPIWNVTEPQRPRFPAIDAHNHYILTKGEGDHDMSDRTSTLACIWYGCLFALVILCVLSVAASANDGEISKCGSRQLLRSEPSVHTAGRTVPKADNCAAAGSVRSPLGNRARMIKTRYIALSQAFNERSFARMATIMLPGYSWRTLDGDVSSMSDVVATLRDHPRPSRMRYTIRSVRADGRRLIAIVIQEFCERTRRDGSPDATVVNVYHYLLRDVWVRSRGRWLLEQTQMLS